jgi:putative DNA primase/helicase
MTLEGQQIEGMSRLLDIEDTPLSDPETYFDEKGRFLASKLAQDMVHYLTIITVTETDEIYSWCNGYYVGGSSGENRIRSVLRTILGDKLLKVTHHEINELVNQVRLWSYQPYSIFTTNLGSLPLLNGVLDIETRELEPYGDLRHYFDFQLPVSYDKEADCSKFKQFVSQVVYPADVLVVQEIFGYCLWGEGLASIKKAIMLLGAGDNGKSLLLSVLVSLLGQRNVAAKTLVSLAENRFASAGLRGKLANINPDLPDRALRETGQFKGLTGDDLVPYEIKHGGSGEFFNQAKLIFSTNKLPDTQDDTDGYYTRWVILNFPYQFVRGKDNLSEHERPAKNKNKLKADLTNPQELSGILNWALEGQRRLQTNGCFSNEISIDKMRDNYVRLANSLKAFVIDRCVLTSKVEDYESREEFYLAYSDYCTVRQLVPFKKEKIGRVLTDYYPGKISGGRDYVGKDRVTTWRGIHLKTDEERACAEDQKTLDQTGEMLE